MFNKIILVGRLGQNPENRFTQGGGAVCNFSLATGKRWKDKQGQPQESTTWHKIAVFGKTAEACAKFLTKGSMVLVEGEISNRSWDGKDGQKHYTFEVIADFVQFLGGKSEASASEEPF